MTLFFNSKLKKFFTIELILHEGSFSRHTPYCIAFSYFGTDRGIRVTDENKNDFKPIAII